MLTATLVAGRLVLLETHSREYARLERFQGKVASISRDGTNLLVLGQDFLLHRSERAARQWHAAHAELTGALPDVTREVVRFDAQFQDNIATVNAITAGLPLLFDAIDTTVRNPERPDAAARLDMLAYQLVAETRRISDNAVELTERLAELRSMRDATERHEALVETAAFATMILAIAVVVSRRVLRPLAALELTTYAVQHGDLKARSGYRTVDEFGSLSRAFDAMTGSLATALRENQALLGTIHLHSIVSVTDPVGRIIDVNDNFCRISGFSRDEVLGRTHRTINSGAHDAAFWTAMWNTIERGQPWRGEICSLAKDGRLYWVDSLIAPCLGEDGTVEKYIAIRNDITAAKTQELRLRSSETLLRTVLDSASDVSIIATDPQFRIKVFNTGAERLLDYDNAEMVGLATPLQIHDPEELQRRGAELGGRLGHVVAPQAVLTEPSMLGQAREWTYIKKGGEPVTVSLMVSAMRADGGELLGYLSVARDVTRQKQYEQSLHEAMRRAEQANHAKTQFLANMSHEIRTPMNAVIGLSYLVRQTRLDAEQSALMAKIGLASKSLLAVINDILDLSKIEAGELLIEKNIFSLHDLLAALADVMAVQAEPKRIGLNVAWSPDVPDRIEGDTTRLNQVLTNLVANAIKFTDHGGVRVQVEVVAATAQAVSLCFTVADTGIGIAPELRDCLFMPFAQADASITRRFGGTGLGLSIVKHLTRLMGGDVALDSTAGVGSIFRVSLDFGLASAEAQAPQPAMPVLLGRHLLQGLRILVVDDSDINRDVARRILESEGASIILAENGLQAVDCLERRPQSVDLVLMDIQMPVLDGREATRRIRRDLSLTTLPIIALTAGALGSERQCALDAGMTDFITKPFDAAALVLRILQCTRPTTLVEPVRSAGPSDASTVPWPEITGIDAGDVRVRLGDDAVLFRALLGRLLDEFADLAMPAPDALLQHQQRLHKLRGSAGILGAKTIRQVAGEAEAACEAGAFMRAAELTTGLMQALHALRCEVDRIFSAETTEQTPDAVDGSGAGSRPLEPEGALQSQELVALLDALRHQSLSALTQFEGMSGRLRHCLGQARYVSLQAHVDHLRFVEAVNVLETAVARQI